MSKDGNGTSATIKVIMFVLAVLGSGITIYSVFHAPLARAITDETTCRQAEDTRLHEALTKAIQDQQETNAETKVVLAQLLVEMKYINKAINKEIR